MELNVGKCSLFLVSPPNLKKCIEYPFKWLLYICNMQLAVAVALKACDSEMKSTISLSKHWLFSSDNEIIPSLTEDNCL